MSSARCISAGRDCEFADAELPLRDRKAVFLPGEQAPWVIDSSSPPMTLVVDSPFAKSVEPFDCLGLDMSLRSRELLHYCKCESCYTPLLAPLISSVHHSHDSSDLILTKASRNMYVPPLVYPSQISPVRFAVSHLLPNTQTPSATLFSWLVYTMHGLSAIFRHTKPHFSSTKCQQ